MKRAASLPRTRALGTVAAKHALGSSSSRTVLHLPNRANNSTLGPISSSGSRFSTLTSTSRLARVPETRINIARCPPQPPVVDVHVYPGVMSRLNPLSASRVPIPKRHLSTSVRLLAATPPPPPPPPTPPTPPPEEEEPLVRENNSQAPQAFNPPGSSIPGAPNGVQSFAAITRSPVLDTAITTFIGLCIGMWIEDRLVPRR